MNFIHILFLIFLTSIEVNGERTDSLRLPHNIRPIHYDWSIDVNFPYDNYNDYSYQIFGGVGITFEVVEATNVIVLNQYELRLTQTSGTVYDLETGKRIDITGIEISDHNETLTIYLSDPLAESHIYIIHINYFGKISDDQSGVGLYVSPCENTDSKKSLMVVTQGETNYARYYIPSFDEPSFKATFSVSIIHHENATALSNGALLRRNKFGYGLVKSVFETTPIMSSYLLTIAVGDLVLADSATTKISNIPVNSYTCPGNINKVKGSALPAAALLDFYEEYFDDTYKMTKLDQLFVQSLLPCAMENWGIITYKIECFGQNVIAHELSHQWFGNLVTNDWWDNFWLNEGLTSFMTEIGQTAIDERYDSDSALADKLVWLLLIDTHHLSPLHMTEAALTPSNILTDDNTKTIVYVKGGSITKMIRNVLGETKMRAVFRHYINKNRYSNVNQHDLCLAIIEGSSDKATRQLAEGVDACLFLYSWTQQSGYPIIKVQMNRTTNTVTVSQEPFVRNIFEINKTDQLLKNYMMQRWFVPIFYGNMTSSNNYVWLKPGQDKLTFQVNFLPDMPLLINPSMKGYYLVMYDTDEYKLIGKYLSEFSQHIPDAIKLQLVFDYISSLYNGYIYPLNYEYDITKDESEFRVGTTFEMIDFIKNSKQVKLLYDVANQFVDILLNCTESYQMALERKDEFQAYKQALLDVGHKTVKTPVAFPQHFMDFTHLTLLTVEQATAKLAENLAHPKCVYFFGPA